MDFQSFFHVQQSKHVIVELIRKYSFYILSICRNKTADTYLWLQKARKMRWGENATATTTSPSGPAVEGNNDSAPTHDAWQEAAPTCRADPTATSETSAQQEAPTNSRPIEQKVTINLRNHLQQCKYVSIIIRIQFVSFITYSFVSLSAGKGTDSHNVMGRSGAGLLGSLGTEHPLVKV